MLSSSSILTTLNSEVQKTAGWLGGYSFFLFVKGDRTLYIYVDESVAAYHDEGLVE